VEGEKRKLWRDLEDEVDLKTVLELGLGLGLDLGEPLLKEEEKEGALMEDEM
jgi:hypothetical protein